MPIKEWYYQKTNDRSRVIEAASGFPLLHPKWSRVADVGGRWSPLHGKCRYDVYDHADKPPEQDLGGGKWTKCELNDLWWSDRWDDEADFYGFALCSHTIEDLYWPQPVLEELPLMAKRGCVIVPSVYHELAQHHGTLGFVHHHWVWRVENGVLTGWPKIPYLCCPEIAPKVAEYAAKGVEEGKLELVVWWEDDLPFRLVELGPTHDEVCRKYREDLLGVHY